MTCRRALSLVLALVFAHAALSSVAFAQLARMRAGSSIYIEEMDSDLDGFLRAEFVKQNLPLKVVLKREDAHIVMVGTSAGNEKRSWHEGWLTAEKDHATGNITVVDRATGQMLWAGEAGDRSLMWGAWARGGQRKVAARLVKKLKKSIVTQAAPLPEPPPLSPEELAAMRETPSDTTTATNLTKDPRAGKPLTNGDVVKMIEAGFSEDLIINRVNASDSDFTLDTDSMIALKSAGVTEKILAAMLDKQKPE